MKRLIVNADDFGYSPSVNKGIIEAHLYGIVTSTSVMVDSIAAEEAKELNTYTDLGVGLHFVYDSKNSISDELNRQVEKFTAIVGAKPDHIDIHKVRIDDFELKNAVIAFAESKRTPARYSGKAKFIDSFFGPHTDGDLSVDRLKRSLIEVNEECNELMCHVGYSDDYLRSLSSYNDMRELELKAICDPQIKSYLNELGVKLVNWRQAKPWNQ